MNEHQSVSPVLLKGRVGLVTGAGSPYGIGRSLVIKLAQAGAEAVYACDLNMSNIPGLQDEIKKLGYSTLVEGRMFDVSSEEETVKVLKEITAKHGRFDFYFANAGYANYRDLNHLESSHFDRQVAVMQRSVYLAIKFGSQAMRVTSERKQIPGGAIVATSSSAAYLGAYADLGYTAVKLAVNGLVMAGSVQLATSNIRVNGIAPGFTQTSILTTSKEAEKGSEYKVKEDRTQIKQNHAQFFERAGILATHEYYFNRTAEPDELANVGIFLASDLASAINGQTILVDSGKTAAATGDGCTGPILPINPLALS